MHLITFGNPLTREKGTVMWTTKAMRDAGLGAREIQDKCEEQGIAWSVVPYRELPNDWED